jgi:hypothetical protein
VTVYVDDMWKSPVGRFGRMRMSHMIASTEDELHAMAERLGLRRAWYQDGHYDVSLEKRRQAVALGAVEITFRQCGCMVALRRATGVLGVPETAVEEFRRLRGGIGASGDQS